MTILLINYVPLTCLTKTLTQHQEKYYDPVPLVTIDVYILNFIPFIKQNQAKLCNNNKL